MDVSVVIPTFNRRNDLEEALMSILIQTKLPKEVIIVDDSDDNSSKELLDQMSEKFDEKSIQLIYVRKNGNRGVTASRNIGIKYVTSEIVMFSDDDVIFFKDFIEKSLEVYSTHPDAIAVQGYIVNDYVRTHDFFHTHLSKIIDAAYRIFLFERFEENSCRILSSGNTTYPRNLPQEILKCQWISGTGSYKKDVFDYILFDEKLTKVYGEDKDFSYRLYKKRKGLLLLTPFAKLLHKASPSHFQTKSKIHVETMYRTYLFLKNIDQSPKNKLAFFWHNFGRLFIKFIIFISKRQFKSVFWLIDSYFSLIKNFDNVKNGIFDF